MKKFLTFINIIFPFWSFTYLLQSVNYYYPIYFKELFNRNYFKFFKRSFHIKGVIIYTARAIITLILSITIFLLTCYLIFFFIDSIFLITIFLIINILLIPLTVFLASIPTIIFRLLYTVIIIKNVKKVKKNSDTKIVAITGSTGKTTTREMLVKILNKDGKVLNTDKNLNTLIGNGEVLSRYKDHKYIVLEFAMDHMKEIAWQCRIIKPDIGAILNVGHVHGENVGGIENVYKAKKELADYINKARKVLVLNVDDNRLEKLSNEIDTELLTFGKNSSDFILKQTEVSRTGTSFIFYYKGREYRCNMNVYGRGLAYNALCSIVIAHKLGVDIDISISALEQYRAFNSRFQIKEIDNAVIVDDSYNANPTSMKMAIETFNDIFSKEEYKRIAILGDMKELGDVANKKHKELGQLTEKMEFDKVYYIGDYYNDFNKGSRIFNWKEAKEILEEIIHKKERVAVLLKASNSIGLYKILEESNT